MLQQDFKTAAQDLTSGMALLTAMPRSPVAIPAVDIRRWSSTKNKCYNFALNRQTDDGLEPGWLSQGNKEPDAENGIEVYAQQVIKNAGADGVQYLSHNFTEAISKISAGQGLDDKKLMAALFFGNPDHPALHWMGLRKDEYGEIVWAEKPGSAPAVFCDPDRKNGDVAGIFRAAKEGGYEYFAGYFEVPANLQKPPVTSRKLWQRVIE